MSTKWARKYLPLEATATTRVQGRKVVCAAGFVRRSLVHGKMGELRRVEYKFRKHTLIEIQTCTRFPTGHAPYPTRFRWAGSLSLFVHDT